MKQKIKVLAIAPNPGGTSGVGGYLRTAILNTHDRIDWVVLSQGLQTPNNRPVLLQPESYGVKLYPSRNYGDVPCIFDLLSYERPHFLIGCDDHWKYDHIRGSLRHFREKFGVQCVLWSIFDNYPAPKDLTEEFDKWDYHFALTKLTEDGLKEMLGKNSPKIFYIPHPVDTSTFRNTGRGNAHHVLKGQLFPDNDYEFVIFHCGNNQHRKNTSTLIYAYSEWCKTMPKDEMDKIGLLIKTDALISPHGVNLINIMTRYCQDREKKKLNGHVHIITKHPTGRVLTQSDMVLLYNLCDLYVQPSRHEGFGLPVSEALLCERFVVANATGGLCEQMNSDFGHSLKGSESIIAHASIVNGIPGHSVSILESVPDYQQIIHAFQCAYKLHKEEPEEVARMGKLGRQFIIDKYEATKVCDKLVHTLRTILEKKEQAITIQSAEPKPAKPEPPIEKPKTAKPKKQTRKKK